MTNGVLLKHDGPPVGVALPKGVQAVTVSDPGGLETSIETFLQFDIGVHTFFRLSLRAHEDGEFKAADQLNDAAWSLLRMSLGIRIVAGRIRN